jgi:hypothetical protein
MATTQYKQPKTVPVPNTAGYPNSASKPNAMKIRGTGAATKGTTFNCKVC